ncbi:hypothetical protein [Vibrio variabilis]|uniref:hypothetical protein n=1 Tax=Vibrio variabilis TaxID=990271 RepID=UPI000DDA6EC5|nr:hypothetical protein [Vibrio variabilis]
MYLIDASSIYTPGSGLIDGDSIPVFLKSDGNISRLAFNLVEPSTVDESSFLTFSLSTTTSKLITADILKGDFGYPEISLQNSLGQVVRFRRGNMKDFILGLSDDRCFEVSLPCSSFLHHTDLKSNIDASTNFFASPITKVSFDFLSNPKGDIELTITKPRFTVARKKAVCATKLLDIFRINNAAFLPPVITEFGVFNLSVSPNNLCSQLYKEGISLSYEVSQDGRIFSSRTVPLNNSVIISFNIPKFGAAQLSLRLIHSDVVVAESHNSYVKTLPAGRACYSLGISDATNFHGTHMLGSKVHRLIVSLNSIVKENGTYRFSGDNNPFYNINAINNATIYIAFKGMPKWLSRSSNSDYGRYAPVCYDEYSKLISWIASQLQEGNRYCIESWNEANVIYEWNDTLDSLRKLHSATYTGIKSINPCIKVLSPSSTSWDFGYFKKLDDVGILDNSDGLSLHGYTYSPEQSHKLFTMLEEFVSRKSKIHKEFKAHITEIGFRTPAFSILEQSEYLSLFTLHSHFSKYVQCINWFRYQNLRLESELFYDQNNSSGYAMIGHQNLYARPSYAAFRWLNTLLFSTEPYSVENNGASILFSGKYKKSEKIIASFCRHKRHKQLTENANIVHNKPLCIYDAYGNELDFNQITDHRLIYLISTT